MIVITGAAGFIGSVVTGTAFLPVESDSSSCFRINYSTPSDENLEEGIKRLAQLMNDKY